MGCKNVVGCHPIDESSLEISTVIPYNRDLDQIRVQHDFEFINASEILQAQILSSRQRLCSPLLESKNDSLIQMSVHQTKEQDENKEEQLDSSFTAPPDLLELYHQRRPNSLTLYCAKPQGVFIESDVYLVGTKDGEEYMGVFYTPTYIFEGCMKNSSFEGFGFYFSKLYEYEGSFSNNKWHGIGCLKMIDGYQYEGEFYEGEKSGIGFENLADGTIRKGIFIKGELFGPRCEIKYPDGMIYNGGVKKNMKHGKGRANWPDGKTYYGDWQEDKMQGFGVLVYGDGRKYEGDFKAGIRDGQGKFWWPDGTQYIGGFTDGKQCGIGTIITKNGLSQDYWWEEGRRVIRCNQSTIYKEPIN